MSISKSKKKTSFTQGDFESGYFVAGLNFYAEKSNNFRVRLGIAKLTRAIEKALEEPFKEFQDMLREFGTKGKEGRMSVIPSNLSPEKAAGWEKTIKAWRARAVAVDNDLIVDGKIKISLPAAVLNQFPTQCIEAMLDHAEFVEVAESKEDEVARLRKEVEALKKGSEPQSPAQ